MSSCWVINASPVICLARAGLLDLLWQMADDIRLPQAVEQEILAGPASDPGRQDVSAGRFQIVAVQDLPEILVWDLGRGETAVLSFVLVNPGCIAIIDDLAARKCAKSFSILYQGILAIVILAKKRGLIPSAANALRSLQAAGLRLEDAVIRTALKEATGEDW